MPDEKFQASKKHFSRTRLPSEQGDEQPDVSRQKKHRYGKISAQRTAEFTGDAIRQRRRSKKNKETDSSPPKKKRCLHKAKQIPNLRYTKKGGHAEKVAKGIKEQGDKSKKTNGMARTIRKVGREMDRAINEVVNSSDNEGLQGANTDRRVIASGARYGRKKGKQWHRGHDQRVQQRALRKQNKTLIRETKEKIYELRHGKPSLRAKWSKKMMMRRQQYAAAIEQRLSGRAVQIAGRAVKTIAKAAAAVIRAIIAWVAAPLMGVLLVICLIGVLAALILSLFMNTVVPITTCYTTSEADLEASSSYMTKLEAQLDYKIKSLPTAWEWAHIDYFHYYLDPIEHDPMALQGYLNVKYPGYTFEEVKTEIDYLFAQRYRLTLHEWSEVAGEEPDEYVVYHLDVTLVAKPLEPILQRELRLDPAQQLYEWYEVLMITQGGRQGVANPFGRDVDWRPYVSSLYGYRVDPEGFGVQLHRGLDIGLSGRVLAGVTGRVLHTGQDAVLGRYVVLAQEGTERRVQYGRCGTVLVSPGEDVAAGQTPVATAGGEDLHIEILDAGEYRNPIFYLMQPSLEVQQ